MRGGLRALLVGAVTGWGLIGVAHADTSHGVTVPAVNYLQGSGVHTVGIVISSGSSLIGSQLGIEFRATESAGVDWLRGLSASSSTGASCSSVSGSGGYLNAECTPGGSGWHAGDLLVSIGTDAANCTYMSGSVPPIAQCPDTYGILVLLPPPPPGASPAPPGSSAWSAGEVVEIRPKSAAPTPTRVATTSGGGTHATTHPSTAASAAKQSSAPTAAAASASASPSPLDAVTSAPAPSGTPVALDAADTASASRSSTSHTVEIVIPFVIVALVLLIAGWRLAGRRQRRDGDSGSDPDSGADPDSESGSDESGE